jgi:hypothetical protein
MPHSIYFIGAGLSKALQQDVPVPLMADFVRVATHYAERDKSRIILTALIGLEALGLFRWKSEVCKTLAQKIEIDRLNSDDVAAFLAALRRRPSESIEDLLNHDTEQVKDVDHMLHNAPLRFRSAINRLFTLIRWRVDLQLLMRFVGKRLRDTTGRHTFVSFNYDLFLDRVIAHTDPNWHWHCGYGFDIPYAITTDPIKPYPIALSPRCHVCSSNTQILKPHGSLNWLLRVSQPNAAMPFNEAPVVARVDAGGNPEYLDAVDDWLRLSYTKEEMPVEVAPGIIAPLRPKDATLSAFRQSREQEITSIKAASDVFVLGWSMPATDDDQRCLIRYAAQLRENPFRRVVVVNLEQSPEYFHTVAETFCVPPDMVEVWNTGFADYMQATEAS